MGRMSIGSIVYIVIGVIVAANRHYFEHLNTLSDVVSAALVILLWPLVLLGLHIAI